jgi:hypothetical protein
MAAHLLPCNVNREEFFSAAAYTDVLHSSCTDMDLDKTIYLNR